EVMNLVEAQGIRLIGFQQMTREEEKLLGNYFMKNIVPFLSVMIVGNQQPFPFLTNRDIYALAILPTKKGEKIGLIPCSSNVFPRLISVPHRENTYVLAEELILHFMPKVYPGYRIREKSLIRVTRNADIDVNNVVDEDHNYRDQMRHLVKLRQKLAPTRLEMSRDISDEMVKKLCGYCGLARYQAFSSLTPLDLSFVFTLEDILRKNPKNVYPRRVPQKSPMIDDQKPMIPQILDHDILLHYPYESIDPFLRLLEEAGSDPQVTCVRMTLYRLASNSKVVEALVHAADNGKQVDVLVELQARFDEANNIEWSRQLEEAGCHVVYGIEGLKVHSKLCQITRRGENGELQLITQIGTGNYNEKTARLYTDLSLMTADERIAQDAAKVFQAIILGETVTEMDHLLVAPNCLQKPVIEMIEEEICHAKAGEPAYIGLKLNSLTDRAIMEKLAEASRAGVRIEMVIRGINCLRSGLPGETDNIVVKSVVGRLLEHSRIYIFGTPDRDRIFIASADFMTRNTLRRVEVGTPIFNEELKARLRGILNTLLADNVQGRIQKSDGDYRTDANDLPPLNAQEAFFDMAYEAAANR
ncbi:MAG: polyphosphate kinase 1, partial [Oscillospiraceae bacterium]|nr:polyphosphate kinase 1 [Oscillospiraceae bacterium]